MKRMICENCGNSDNFIIVYDDNYLVINCRACYQWHNRVRSSEILVPLSYKAEIYDPLATS